MGGGRRTPGSVQLGNKKKKTHLRVGGCDGVDAGAVARDIRPDIEGWVKVWIFIRSVGDF